MNTRQQGDLAVADAIAYYTNKGYIISFPMTEAARYDLIIDKSKLLRVQCKCTGDIVFIRTMSGDRYAIPINVIEGKSIITLGTKYQQYRLGV